MQYAAELREKTAKFKKCKTDLQEIRAEVAILARTEQLLSKKDETISVRSFVLGRFMNPPADPCDWEPLQSIGFVSLHQPIRCSFWVALYVFRYVTLTIHNKL